MLNGHSRSTAKPKAEQLLTQVGLKDEMNKKAGKYSRGMRQRLGLADVLIKTPEVIILDEPTSGIDPKGVREFLELIVSLSKKQGLTVLFSSHHLHQVQQVCDRVGLFVSGKLLAEGNIQKLSQELFTNNAYLIEAGISANADGESGKKYTVDWMKKILKSVEGVKAVSVKNGIFQIECSDDATADIARVIVESGAGLRYLNRKEYGLDDIYYRYFEGGEHHE